MALESSYGYATCQHSLKNFTPRSACVIIDYTKILTEVPSSMSIQSLTCSSFKYHDTFKGLTSFFNQTLQLLLFFILCSYWKAHRCLIWYVQVKWWQLSDAVSSTHSLSVLLSAVERLIQQSSTRSGWQSAPTRIPVSHPTFLNDMTVAEDSRSTIASTGMPETASTAAFDWQPPDMHWNWALASQSVSLSQHSSRLSPIWDVISAVTLKLLAVLFESLPAASDGGRPCGQSRSLWWDLPHFPHCWGLLEVDEYSVGFCWNDYCLSCAPVSMASSDLHYESDGYCSVASLVLQQLWLGDNNPQSLLLARVFTQHSTQCHHDL